MTITRIGVGGTKKPLTPDPPLMHIHGLLAADFHAHLLKWHGARSQVGWILALSV